jgi:hypothetical protein
VRRSHERIDAFFSKHCEVGWGAKIHEIDAFFLLYLGILNPMTLDGTGVGPMHCIPSPFQNG